MRGKLILIACVVVCTAQAKAANFGRIMALGDSITGGTAGEAPNSYREPLDQMLFSAGHTYNWYGPNQWGTFSTGKNNWHAGMGGWDVDNLLNGLDTQPGAGKLSDWLPVAQPDTVLFLTNINGFWRWGNNYPGNPTVQAEAMAWNNTRLRQVIDMIYAHNPNAQIFFSSPTHVYQNAGSISASFNLYADDLHALVEGIANEYAGNGKKMKFVSITPLTSTQQGVHAGPDGVHWNTAGSLVGATAFYDSMTAAPVPEPATLLALGALSVAVIRKRRK